MSTEHPNDIVRVAIATSTTQVHIWENALRDEGIDCKVVGDMLEIGISGPGMQSEIWVHEKDAARAREIIDRKPE